MMIGRFDDRGVVDLAYRALASAQMLRGDFEAALVQLDEAIAHSRENRGRDHLIVGYALLSGAQCLQGLRRFEDAERDLGECRAIFQRWLGPGHRDLGMVCLRTMSIAFRNGDRERGLEQGDAMIEHLSKTPEPTPCLAYACMKVAEALAGVGSYEAAFARCEGGIAHLRAHPEWPANGLLAAMERLEAKLRERSAGAGGK